MSFRAEFQRRAKAALPVVGDAISYTPAAFPHPTVGQTISIYGVFERPFLEAGNIESSVPTVEISLDDVAAPAHGDHVQVDGEAQVYVVLEVHPDGTGFVTLILGIE